MKVLNEIVFNQTKFAKAYLILTFIFVTIASEIKILPSIFSKVMLLWGVIISVYTAINTYKKSKEDRLIYLVIALFIVQAISILFTRIGGSEVIGLIINFFFIFVMAFSTVDDYSKYRNDFNRLLKLFIYLSFIISIFGLYLLVMKREILVNENMYGYVNVMRFTGLYTNENAQGIVSFISIALSVAMFFLKKNNIELFIFVVNIPLQLVILLNSKANSATLAIIVFVAFFIFVYFKNSIFRVLYGVILIASPLYVLRKIIISNKLETLLNGRYELWITAMKVIKNHILLGVGNSNLVPEMEKATNQTLEGIEGGGLHNIFLQVTAINGVIMLLVLLAILLWVYILGIRYIDKINGSSNRLFDALIISTSISILVINMFEANIVYMVSCISIVFWSLIGYTYRSLRSKGGVFYVR